MVSYGALDSKIGKTHEMGGRAFRRRSCRFGGEGGEVGGALGAEESQADRQTGKQADRRVGSVELEEMKQVFQPSSAGARAFPVVTLMPPSARGELLRMGGSISPRCYKVPSPRSEASLSRRDACM